MKYQILFLFIFLCVKGISQNTLGLISYQKDFAYDGYNLVYPHNQPNVYLLNNCGEIVHTWTDSANWRPGNTVYITKEGKLIKCKRDANVTQDKIWAGGGGAIVEIRDWNNNLEWSFELNDSLQRLHHDIAPMPNGNILMTVWNKKNKDELIAAGRDTSLFKEDFLLSESIIEVEPSSKNIVWKWDLWDHIIQNFDPSKPKFGVIKDNPGKINFNYQYRKDEGSWFHINALDYNQELDQIMVSTPVWDELWIIDHTTTTQQAAGSTGGFSNKGGDLMYRWGNPRAYDKNDVFNQTLFFQHDVHWVNDFIRNDHPLKGSILAFNNQFDTNYSSVSFVRPPWDMYEWSYTKTNGAWGPDTYLKTVTHPQKTMLYSPRQSSVQLLPNDNMLILSGRLGYVFEVTPDEKVVWEYIIPFKNGSPATQGSSILPQENQTFRIKRYPADFVGFAGKDLSSKGYIELNPDVNYCSKLVNTHAVSYQDFKLYPNPSFDVISVEIDSDSNVKVFQSSGKEMISVKLQKGHNQIDVSFWPQGLYFITGNEGIIKAFNVIK